MDGIHSVIESLHERARQAALQAGEELKRRFRRDVEVQMKGRGDPVTEADHAAARVLEAMLLRPPVKEWLCEEANDRPDGSCYWVVDPMDGTRSFLRGHPEFTVSIALVEENLLQLGIVYNPITGECFEARRGQGAWLDGQRLRVRYPLSLQQARLLASRSELANGFYTDFIPCCGAMERSGSIAYKLAVVAAGQVDATLSRTPKALWDIAAGALLVQEAGGEVRNLAGERLEPVGEQCQGIVAAAPALLEELLAALQRTGADQVISRRTKFQP